jgi:heme a synthase
MSLQPLFDLSPLARLMFVGILLAAGPLLWVWWRNRGASPVKWLHALTLLTLVLTFDLVLFGAFTRLSDSGLGCPDWPGCYGNASPLGAKAQIDVAQAAMPSGPVTTSKAWVEMIHRYLATGVGVLIAVLAGAAWRYRAQAESISPWWATATLVWVCVQGAFGALTVTMKLFPAIVTLHLLGALLLLALLTVQVVQQGALGQSSLSRYRMIVISPSVQKLAWLTFAALTMQIALGGWVSTNYAVLACNEFPQCQGSWWPAMNFEQGFEIWRKLGFTQSGDVIGFEALTAIHYAHRMMAVIVIALTGALAWALNGVSGMRTTSRCIAALIGLQFATGLSNVVLDWPLFAALLHTGGAAALVIALTWVVCAGRTGVQCGVTQVQGMNVSRLNA